MNRILFSLILAGAMQTAFAQNYPLDNTIKVEAPVHLHDVLVENILGTGVNVLAARDAERTD